MKRACVWMALINLPYCRGGKPLFIYALNTSYQIPNSKSLRFWHSGGLKLMMSHSTETFSGYTSCEPLWWDKLQIHYCWAVLVRQALADNSLIRFTIVENVPLYGITHNTNWLKLVTDFTAGGFIVRVGSDFKFGGCRTEVGNSFKFGGCKIEVGNSFKLGACN